jgi:WhiB family redox-sensing transcriptional regulator
VGNGNSSPNRAGGTPLDPWDPSQRDSKLADLLTAENLGWQDKANCKGADADLFFPERGASTRKAKTICAACQVRVECLEFALMESEKFGIWGGLSERERRRIRKQRALRRAAAG